MRIYQVRDENGVLKAIIDELHGRSVFQNLDGEWSTNKAGNRLYTLKCDGKIASPLNQIITYLWAGDVLVENVIEC